MRRFHRQFELILYCALGVIALIGCRTPKERIRLEATGVESRPYVDVFNDVYDLQSDAQSITECDLVESDLAQPVLRSEQIPEARHEISLNEVVRIGLSNANVLKDLNARILDNPAVVASRHDPAIRATDPTFGIAAALSDFDTRFTADVNYQNNDQVFNNAVLGGGANTLRQDLTVGNIGFERTLMNGASYAIRGNSQHDDNDRPGNLFPSSWRTRLEMEMRQPLMQGRGTTFNQIFGPNFTQPTQANGVVISRINQDISIAQFERDLNDYLAQVIRAYWELYLAYQNVELNFTAYQDAKDTWDIAKARYEAEIPGGEADRESQAREQYFAFQGILSEAIYGNRQANQVGLLQAEANLRRLIGLAQSSEELLKPSDQPNVGDIQYDWASQSQQALGNRVELREQRSRIKRRELELLGVRNFALPRLDAVAIYRNNGFGDDLIGRDVGVPFSNAFDVANDSQFEEWEVGLQMAVPVGYRRAFSAIRNAELQLNRERLILAEQKKEVLHGLGTSMRAIFNFFKQSEIATNRLSAANDTVEARKAAYEAGAGSFNELLEAQRNLATSKQSYYQATINWAIGLAEVDQQTGQLLANYGVFFDEVHSSLASN